MDLRDVLNEDASNARITKVPLQSTPNRQPHAQEYFPQQHPSQISPAAYPPHPTPPTPHSQYPSQHGFRPPSSSGPPEPHWQRSPGHTPSRSFASNQFPFPQHPQSPAHPHPPSYGSRDSHSSIPPAGVRVHHQSPAQQSPSGPPLSATSVQPPPLHHSLSRPSPTPTPSSHHDPATQSIRESPISSHSSSQIAHQHYPSQPNTPLGPPPLLYQRSSTHGFRDPLSPHVIHQRTYSGTSHAGSSMQSASPPIKAAVGPAVESPQAHVRQSLERNGHGHTDPIERERSLSVSPKTRVPSQSQILELKRGSSHDQWKGHAKQPYHEQYREGRELSTTSTTENPISPDAVLSSSTPVSGNARLRQPSLSHLNTPIDGARGSFHSAEAESQNSPLLERSYGNQHDSASNTLRNQHPETGTERYAQPTGGVASHPTSSTTHLASIPSRTPSEPAPILPNNGPASRHAPHHENSQTPLGSVLHKPLQETQSLPRPANRDQNVTAKPVQPPPKRVKYDEPPIWARRSPITAHIREQRLAHVSKQDRSNSRFQSRSVTPMPAKSPAPSEVNGTRGPMARPDFEETNDGPLGYWERCITNVEPYNDVTRIVTDFIYSELERRPDVDVTDVGGNVSPNGQIEIEAKLGTLVDRRNNERIRLPIVSSVILDLEARKHVAFESFMTEQQHKALNDFLNAEARKSHSRPPPGQRPRVKIHYEHKRERDSFHELTQAGFLSLPAAARNAVESQGTLKRTKVRVTKEQKTGRETARIVKCRLVDLDIYCPREAFDVRISINLEVGFQGELDDTNKVKFPDRVKDRLSYLHQAYQIDLTQVTDGGGSGEKTHELEVEVSSAEVRKQMRLLQEGRENELERLIKVFLDNVKVLSRAILPMG